MRVTIEISDAGEGVSVTGVEAGETEPTDVELPTESGTDAPDAVDEAADVEPAPQRFRGADVAGRIDQPADSIVDRAEPAPPKFRPERRDSR